MTDKEENFVTVRLAEFNGVSTVDGRIYKMDKATLTKFLDKQIGKPIGEIGTDAFRNMSGDLSGQLERINTVETVNMAGVLRGYDILEDNERLLVTGHVSFSPALQKYLETVNDQQPTFGLRALGFPNSADNSFQVDKLISFDYVPPHRRA